jgi:hypothetical protein
MYTKQHLNTEEIKKFNTKYGIFGGQPFFRKIMMEQKVNNDDVNKNKNENRKQKHKLVMSIDHQTKVSRHTMSVVHCRCDLMFPSTQIGKKIVRSRFLSKTS